MVLRWFYTPVATLCLLVVAAPASAECAWVMWAFTLGKAVMEYYPDSAHPTRQECLRDVHEMAAAMKRKGYVVTDGGPSSSDVIGEKGTTTLKYFCLPDTVDPRGPKGR